jgi:Arc/MetJ-type ribon-helix-helix transcriptional regulator
MTVNEKKRRADTQIINLRMPSGLVTEIESIVDQRMFKSRSDFIIAAVRHYIDYMSYDEIAGNKGREEILRRMYLQGQLKGTNIPIPEDYKKEEDAKKD